MDDLELRDLDQFSGTQQYFKCWLGALATDGVNYIMGNGYSWLVTDALSVIKLELKDEPFLVVKLKVKDNKAVMTIEDGNGKVFHTQDYDYTSAKKDLTLYFVENVLMLSGEY